MRRLYLLLIAFLLTGSLLAQVKNNFTYSGNDYNPLPSQVIDNFSKTHSQGAIIKWNTDLIKQSDGSYFFNLKTPITFTCLGIGWGQGSNAIPSSAFIVKYRAKIAKGTWSPWYEDEGYINPNETPTAIYWTDLLFLDNEAPHHELEFIIFPPNQINLTEVRLSLIDLTGTEDLPENQLKNTTETQICPPLPTIIPRSTWCGSYTACHNTTSYTNIAPTHTVIHHGASPDTYTDGATVVRGYWNYHVNTLGWSDIGYNYLFDKFGNMYQGRHNPNLPNTDVRGAHAGSANDGSIGLNFLGNADVTLPTTVQLDKLKAFLAWWYDHKGFDPTSSEGMTTQAYGWQVKPRICGHLDVGQTSCPGTTLYNLLPSIRTDTKAIIDACGTPPPTGPQNLLANTSSCQNMTFTMNWENSGTGWYIQVSTATDYSNPYLKWVSGLTTYTGPSGFVLQSNGTTPLTLLNGTTYYWRIWNGSIYTVGPSFDIPFCDSIPPITLINTPGNWKTQDFTATFSDYDNSGGSGISKKYYQVLDFDNNTWSGNAQRGFFGDNFDNLNPSVWTIPTGGGTWNCTSGELIQSDESISNTNIYAALSQTLSNRYLYHFTAKVEGAGHVNGRRFGFHYFCDDASLTNRGNSYFVWFRVETDKMEFYKVSNDVFTMIDEIDDIVTVPGTTYDFKIIYDRITGDHYVYRNDILLGSWKDTNPYTTDGNFISFRSGNSKLTINDLKVYRTRNSTALISLGNNPTKDIRYQNPSPQVSSAKIKSIVIDSAGIISPITYHDLNIDWTMPSDINYVNDGSGLDADTTISYTQIKANWPPSDDSNSDIADYWTCIGTAPGDSNIVGWTNIGLNTSATISGLNLIFNTIYYTSVRARNNAGLFSNIVSSDGQVVYNNSAVLAANFITQSNSVCEGDSIIFSNQSMGASSYEWDFQGGIPATSTLQNPVVKYSAAGTYNVELRIFNNFGNSDTLSLNNYIMVHSAPNADYNVVDSIIYLPNAFAYFTNNSTYATNYLWSFGDSYISTDYNPWHQYTSAGAYTISLVALNSICKNDTLIKTAYIHVVDPNSIAEPGGAFTVQLLNNPVNEALQFSINAIEPLSLNIELFDIIGKRTVLSHGKTLGVGIHIIRMPLGDLAQGIYTCILTTDKGEQRLFKVLISGKGSH